FVQNQSPIPNAEYHGTHVLGIIGASANNGTGIAGGCQFCSLVMGEINRTWSSLVSAIDRMYARGVQVINLSLGEQPYSSCISETAVCDAVAAANLRDVLIIAAAGNLNKAQPDFPASISTVLSAGGAENTNSGNPSLTNWAPWYFGPYSGETYATNHAGVDGVMAPPRSIASTVPMGMLYIPDDPTPCSDNLPVDESGTSSDGVGSCTGTSMATPHASALAGILRSINPRFAHASVQNLMRSQGTLVGAQTSLEGYGMVDASAA